MAFFSAQDPAPYATKNPSLTNGTPTFFTPPPLPQPTQPVLQPPSQEPVVSEVNPFLWGALKYNDFVPTQMGFLKKALVVGGASFNPYISVPPPISNQGKFLTMPPSKWAGSNGNQAFTEAKYA